MGSTLRKTVYSPDTLAPTTPSGLTATAVGQTQINLACTATTDAEAPTNAVSSGLRGYRWYVSTDGVSFSLLAETTSPAYSHTGLTASTTRYYRVAAIDVATNESAQSSRVAATTEAAVQVNRAPVWKEQSIVISAAPGAAVSRTISRGQTADATDVWDLDGDTLTISEAAGGSSTLAALGLTVSASGVISGTIPANTPAGNYTIRLAADDGYVAAEADWLARSTGAGVIWAHRFESADEVSKFTDVGNDAKVLWSSSGGPGDAGYIRCMVPAGDVASGNNWTRPFAALPGDRGYVSGPDYDRTLGTNFKSGYYGHPDYWAEYGDPYSFAGSEFYIQYRVRVPYSRWAAGAPNDGKVVFLATTWHTPAQELVMGAKLNGLLYGYINFAGGDYANIMLDPQLAVDRPNGTEVAPQPGGDYDATCTFVAGSKTINSMDTAGCWTWPNVQGTDEWVTLLLHVELGHHETADSTLELFVAEDGAYRTIISKSDRIWVFEDGEPRGLNALRCGAYYNGAVWPVDFEQDYTEIIFSTQLIPCPQS